MFFIKSSTINIDCFVSNETVYDNFRIDHSSKFYPESLKSVPTRVDIKASPDPASKLISKIPTIKMCPGITELFTSGIILPSWHSFFLEMTEYGNCVISSRGEYFQTISADQHPRIQYGDVIYKGYTHTKLLSPWLIKEKSGVKFAWNMCNWHKTENASNVTILPAVVDYKYQINTHVNMFVKNDSIISYDAGDPLVHMIPLTDKKIKLHHHLVSIEDWHKMRIKSELHNTYPNHRKLTDNKESKCPFGFGK